MESNAYAYLLPSIGELFSGTPAGVSACVWLIMYAFLMYAGNYVLTRYFKAKKLLGTLNNFSDQLNEGLESAQDFARDLIDAQSTKRLGVSLRDLIGNLAEHQQYDPASNDPNQIQYISSTQLTYYINTRDLMPDLFDNKFVGFVPSLMTGFGVLGTFIGIQLGIGGLDFNVDDIENVTNSITMLLAGSTVAFMTSIWGIFFSLIFSVTEKSLLRKLQSDVLDRAFEIGRKIEFVSPENEIVKMREYGQQSVEALAQVKDAIEKIDFKVLVDGISDQIKTAVESTSSSNEQSEKNREMIQEAASLIVSELRLIKEASQTSDNSSSFVNIR